MNIEREVMILCPTGQDASLLGRALLSDGVRSSITPSIENLLAQSLDDMGAMIIAEEALTLQAVEGLNKKLLTQDPWSEIPIILLTGNRGSRDMIAKRLENFVSSGNVTILERPFKPLTLLSVVRVALRARHRQFQVRDLLVSQVDATRVRDDFISIAGHELKTPLTSLKLQAQINIRHLQDTKIPFEDRLRKLAIYTIKQVGRLDKLVDDMLDISRINKGKLQLQKEEFDFAKVLEELIENFMPQFEAVGCKVHSDIVASLPYQGDAYKLEQVINNLFTNAVRYAPKSKLDISLKETDSKVVLKVADKGPGLKPEFVMRIFERFEKGENKSPGLGLGLYISQEIIKLHEGSIRVESEFGKGSSFIVELPLETKA